MITLTSDLSQIDPLAVNGVSRLAGLFGVDLGRPATPSSKVKQLADAWTFENTFGSIVNHPEVSRLVTSSGLLDEMMMRTVTGPSKPAGSVFAIVIGGLTPAMEQQALDLKMAANNGLDISKVIGLVGRRRVSSEEAKHPTVEKLASSGTLLSEANVFSEVFKDFDPQPIYGQSLQENVLKLLRRHPILPNGRVYLPLAPGGNLGLALAFRRFFRSKWNTGGFDQNFDQLWFSQRAAQTRPPGVAASGAPAMPDTFEALERLGLALQEVGRLPSTDPET